MSQGQETIEVEVVSGVYSMYPTEHASDCMMEGTGIVSGKA